MFLTNPLLFNKCIGMRISCRVQYQASSSKNVRKKAVTKSLHNLTRVKTILNVCTHRQCLFAFEKMIQN